jgi:hypothetical protein
MTFLPDAELVEALWNFKTQKDAFASSEGILEVGFIFCQ